MGHNRAAGACRARYVVGALLCLSATVAAATGTRTLHFDVLLDGKSIGSHTFSVARDAQGGETVTSQARFEVKFIGVTVYRYRHQALEQWRDGCLVRMVASTSDNGRDLEVRGTGDEDGFRLDEPAGTASRDECVASYAYWDRDRLLRQDELLNPQTGKFDAVRLESLGEQMVEVDGVQRPAQRYQLQGEGIRIDLWYAADGQWLQLASMARGGRELLYRLRP